MHKRDEIWIAQTTLNIGRPEIALDLLQEDLKTGNYFAIRIAGQCYMQLGKPEAAIKAWVQIGDYISLINLAQGLETDNPAIALLAYQSAQSVNPYQGTLPLVTFLQKQPDQARTAESVLRKAIQDYPTANEYAIWQRILAGSLEKRGQWQQAQAIYQEILRTNPDDYYAWINFGWMQYETLGEFENALASFKKAILIAPKNGFGYFTVARLIVAEERYTEADKWFQQAVDLNPDNASWWHSWAEAAIASERFQQALAINQMGMGHTPENQELTIQQARIFQSMGDIKAAISVAQQAISRGNLDTWQWLQAGRIYQWAGEIPSAIEAYQKALILMPENSQAQYHLDQLQTDE
jgi:tetratricopeptide (TPR) repeat protein